MIYFTIDNDLHFFYAKNIIKELDLNNSQFVFIVHEWPDNIGKELTRNRRVFEYDCKKIVLTGFTNMRLRTPLTLLKAFKHKLYIDQLVKFQKKDVLVFYTEYQLNNHYFAKKIKSVGGRVFLFDEGVGFHFGNSPYLTHDKSTIKDKVNCFRADIPFKILGIPTYNKIDQGGFSLTLRDLYIDAIFSSLRLPINRDVIINGYKHFNFIPQNILFKDKVLFLTSSMTLYGLEKEEFEISKKILLHLQKNFREVYLKIHPGDYVSRTKAYYFFMNFLSENPGIIFIGNDYLAEEAIVKYGIGLIISPMSTALFSATFIGCESVFFYHLLPDRKNFGVYNYVLNELSYNFIKKISDITPYYQSRLNPARLTYNKELCEYSQLFN